jgi:hypothetical protein
MSCSATSSGPGAAESSCSTGTGRPSRPVRPRASLREGNLAHRVQPYYLDAAVRPAVPGETPRPLGEAAHGMCCPASTGCSACSSAGSPGHTRSAVDPGRLQSYLDESIFGVQPAACAQRGLLFFRLLERAVEVGPITYRGIVAVPARQAGRQRAGQPWPARDARRTATRPAMANRVLMRPWPGEPLRWNRAGAGNRHKDMGYVRTPVIVRWIAIVLAFAVPALAGCASSRGPAGTQPAASSQLTGIVGFRWRIAEVRHGAAGVTVPRTRGGYFAFTPEGDLVAGDTVNNYAGRFASTANGYHVTTMRVSSVGYGGHDPVTLALIGGTQALTEAGVDVTVRLTGIRLDLSAGDYRITAVRAGPAGILPSPVPSPAGMRS